MDRALDEFYRYAKSNPKFVTWRYINLVKNAFYRTNRIGEYNELVKLACNNMPENEKISEDVLKMKIRNSIVACEMKPEILDEISVYCKTELEKAALEGAKGLLQLLTDNKDTASGERSLSQSITMRNTLFSKQGNKFEMPNDPVPNSPLGNILYTTNPLMAAAETAFVLFSERLNKAKRAVGLGNYSWGECIKLSLYPLEDQELRVKLEKLEKHPLVKAVKDHLSKDFLGTKGMKELLPFYYQNFSMMTSFGKEAHKTVLTKLLKTDELKNDILLHRYVAKLIKDKIYDIKDFPIIEKYVFSEEFSEYAHDICVLGRLEILDSIDIKDLRTFIFSYIRKPFVLRTLESFISMETISSIVNEKEGEEFLGKIINMSCSEFKKACPDKAVKNLTDSILLVLIPSYQLLQLVDNPCELPDELKNKISEMLIWTSDVIQKIVSGAKNGGIDQDILGEVLFEATTFSFNLLLKEKDLSDSFLKSVHASLGKLVEVSISVTINPSQNYKGLAMVCLRLLSLLSPRDDIGARKSYSLPRDPINIFAQAVNISGIQCLSILPLFSLSAQLSTMNLTINPSIQASSILLNANSDNNNSGKSKGSNSSSAYHQQISGKKFESSQEFPYSSLYSTVRFIQDARTGCAFRQYEEMVEGILARGTFKSFLDMLWLRERSLLDCNGIISAVFVGLLDFLSDFASSKQAEKIKLLTSNKLNLPDFRTVSFENIKKYTYLDNTDHHISEEILGKKISKENDDLLLTEQELSENVYEKIPQVILDTEFILYSSPISGHKAPRKSSPKDCLIANILVCCYTALDEANHKNSTEVIVHAKENFDALYEELIHVIDRESEEDKYYMSIPNIIDDKIINFAFEILLHSKDLKTKNISDKLLGEGKELLEQIKGMKITIPKLSFGLLFLISTFVIRNKQEPVHVLKTIAGKQGGRGKSTKAISMAKTQQKKQTVTGQMSTSSPLLKMLEEILNEVKKVVEQTEFVPLHSELLTSKATKIFKTMYSYLKKQGESWIDELLGVAKKITL